MRRGSGFETQRGIADLPNNRHFLYRQNPHWSYFHTQYLCAIFVGALVFILRVGGGGADPGGKTQTAVAAAAVHTQGSWSSAGIPLQCVKR